MQDDTEFEAYLAWCEHANINPDDPRCMDLWEARLKLNRESLAEAVGEARQDAVEAGEDRIGS